MQAARPTGHSLDVFVRVYADDDGKAQRDEAPERMLAAGFGGSASTAVGTELEQELEVELETDESPALAGPSGIGAPRFELGTSSPPD